MSGEALKQKIEAMGFAELERMVKDKYTMYSDMDIYRAGAQSLVPLVESLAEALEGYAKFYDCNVCRKSTVGHDAREALTNYRKFIGEKE